MTAREEALAVSVGALIKGYDDALSSERALADRLAEALEVVQNAGYELHSPGNQDMVDAALGAWRAARGKA